LRGLRRLEPGRLTGACQPGLVHTILSESWLDHGTFTDDATDDVGAYC
jgi:hypothetical protein